jgi:Transposase, Mutator family
MTDANTTLPPALARAWELLADPPTKPDVSKGYLDLLDAGPVEDAALPKNTGCRRRGMTAPVLAVGDGALGFWKALREVFPNTREQRCWFHVQANVLANNRPTSTIVFRRGVRRQ